MKEITCSKSGNDYLPLRDELKELSRQGIRLTLGGRDCSPERIARTCIMSEDCNYMRDYIADGQGRITGIDFNKINLDSL